MSRNEDKYNEFVKLLTGLSLKDKVEILANVTMLLGLSGMGVEQEVIESNVADIILTDKNRNGETIANALALQGLTMMLWVNEKG